MDLGEGKLHRMDANNDMQDARMPDQLSGLAEATGRVRAVASQGSSALESDATCTTLERHFIIRRRIAMFWSFVSRFLLGRLLRWRIFAGLA